jgi:DNA-binding Lrp family transcriptional regulator
MQKNSIPIMKKVFKPTNYEEFKSYLKTIVLYQANNKRFRDWSIKRRATINFTIRQLERVTRLPRSTCHRYLKKMKEEGLISLAEVKETKRGYRDMKFYYIKEIIEVIRAKAKVRAYKFIKMKITEARENGTLIINLFHKLKKTKICLVRGLESREFLLRFQEKDHPITDYDLRRNEPEKIETLDRLTVSNFFTNLLETI